MRIYYVQDQGLDIAFDNQVDAQVSAQKPEGVKNMHYKGNYYSLNQEICVTAQLYMPHCLEWLWTMEFTPYRDLCN